MTGDQYKQLAQEDASLYIGQPVKVRWGYGLGFRQQAHGVIVKVNEKSVRVQLTEDVYHPGFTEPQWRKGFVLSGIPRLTNWEKWNPEFCVIPERKETR